MQLDFRNSNIPFAHTENGMIVRSNSLSRHDDCGSGMYHKGDCTIARKALNSLIKATPSNREKRKLARYRDKIVHGWIDIADVVEIMCEVRNRIKSHATQEG